MKCVDNGHRYELDSMDGTNPQFIQFIKKELNEDTREFETVEDGTTNEEVLAVVIDRMRSLQAKASCRQNALAITKLEEALMWLNDRTADRERRGVENTPKE